MSIEQERTGTCGETTEKRRIDSMTMPCEVGWVGTLLDMGANDSMWSELGNPLNPPPADLVHTVGQLLKHHPHVQLAKLRRRTYRGGALEGVDQLELALLFDEPLDVPADLRASRRDHQRTFSRAEALQGEGNHHRGRGRSDVPRSLRDPHLGVLVRAPSPALVMSDAQRGIMSGRSRW